MAGNAAAVQVTTVDIAALAGTEALAGTAALAGTTALAGATAQAGTTARAGTNLMPPTQLHHQGRSDQEASFMQSNNSTKAATNAKIDGMIMSEDTGHL